MRSMANYFTPSLRKKGSFFDELCQIGVTSRNYESYPVFFHKVFKHLFERKYKWDAPLCNSLPHIWCQLKPCFSVAHHWFCILIPYQKDWGNMWIEEWKIFITVSPAKPCVRWGTAGWDSAVGGIASATPECLPCLCHPHGTSQTLLSEGIWAPTACWSRYAESMEDLYTE